MEVGGAGLETTLARVTARVDAIADKVDSVNSNGGLSPFNRAYKAYRQAKVAAGRWAIPYRMAVARPR
jgi:hypothetical protein